MIRAFQLIIGAYPMPDWFIDAIQKGRINSACQDPKPNRWAKDGVVVDTPFGSKLAMPADWVICTEKNSLFVVKRCDFERTYDLKPPLQGRRADIIILDELDDVSK